MNIEAQFIQTEKTASGDIYEELKEQLVAGRFIQGSKLRPDRLRQTFNCSATTLREVFLRLAANGFLDALPQRGFRVPRTSPDIRNDLIGLRLILEQNGVKASIANADLAWEARLVAAHHKLAGVEKEIRKAAKIVPHLPLWNQAELEFHQALISNCGSSLMIETHKNIFDRFRMHLLSDDTRRGFDGTGRIEHREILDSAISRNADQCCKILATHINKNFSDRSKFLLAARQSRA